MGSPNPDTGSYFYRRKFTHFVHLSPVDTSNINAEVLGSKHASVFSTSLEFRRHCDRIRIAESKSLARMLKKAHTKLHLVVTI
ncbi:hypothetical protein E2C01_091778 [Portunus trituberculatus]|uniref:Uncharacterized protein n=1 Tax=Portunus trituberculatus TaxID=210409 RepID=A0A5B7JPK3_PORTR|nr:hypothetical protein [Portunus trituberculatus]